MVLHYLGIAFIILAIIVIFVAIKELLKRK